VAIKLGRKGSLVRTLTADIIRIDGIKADAVDTNRGQEICTLPACFTGCREGWDIENQPTWLALAAAKVVEEVGQG